MALMKNLPAQSSQSAQYSYSLNPTQKQFERVLRDANIPPSAFSQIEAPVYLIKPQSTQVAFSQTATYSELLVYLGFIIMLLGFFFRQKLLS